MLAKCSCTTAAPLPPSACSTQALLEGAALPKAAGAALNGFALQGFGIRHVLNPNPYSGAFGNDGPRYAEDVADVIQTCTPGGVAGFIAETIQGVGGTVPLATGYLPAAYEVCVPLSPPTHARRCQLVRGSVSQQGAVCCLHTSMLLRVGNRRIFWRCWMIG